MFFEEETEKQIMAVVFKQVSYTGTGYFMGSISDQLLRGLFHKVHVSDNFTEPFLLPIPTLSWSPLSCLAEDRHDILFSSTLLCSPRHKDLRSTKQRGHLK